MAGESKDRDVVRAAHGIERVNSHLVKHVEMAAQHVRPGGSNVRVRLDRDPIDRRRAEIVIAIRAHFRGWSRSGRYEGPGALGCSAGLLDRTLERIEKK